MKFLANENFPIASVELLRQRGHDIRAVITDSAGLKDAEVLLEATKEGRMILTFDRDYGELVFRGAAPQLPGVIYFRFDPLTPEEPANVLLESLSVKGFSVEEKFTVIERNRIRQRPLP